MVESKTEEQIASDHLIRSTIRNTVEPKLWTEFRSKVRAESGGMLSGAAMLNLFVSQYLAGSLVLQGAKIVGANGLSKEVTGKTKRK